MITTQLYPASWDNFFPPANSTMYTLTWAPPYNVLCSRNLSQDTDLSVKQPKTRSQSQTPNHSRHRLLSISHIILEAIYAPDEVWGPDYLEPAYGQSDHLTKLGLASFPGSPAPKHTYVLYLKRLSTHDEVVLNPSWIPELLPWIYLFLAL